MENNLSVIISPTTSYGSCYFCTKFRRPVYHIGPVSKGSALELTFVFLHCLGSQTIPPDSLVLRTSTGNSILVTNNYPTVTFQKCLPHYRWHCQAYPNCIELSNDLICELRALVLHFIIGILSLHLLCQSFILIFASDGMTSLYANLPYDIEDLDKILARIDSLKG